MKVENYWLKLLVVFFVSIVTSYFIAGMVRSVVQQTDLTSNMLDFDGQIDYFLNQADYQAQLVVLILTAVVFGFLVSKIGGKSGYEYADEHGVHGTSRWGRVEELKQGRAISSDNKVSLKDPFKTLSVEDGIVLGKVPEKNEILIMPTSTSVDNSNVFLIGASGSGKGQSFVFNNIINNTSKTMIITDPKGELYHATHQIKRDQGFEVFQVDFLNLDQAKYNPLDYVVKDIDAKKVAEAIAKNSSKDGKEDFFFTTARDLLTGLIIYCKSENSNANIPVDVKRQFYKVSEDENYLWELCEEIGESHAAYAYLKDASVADGKTRTSILSSFAQQTAIFSLKDVEKMTVSSDFNFHEFQDRKSILYVKIPMKSNPVEALTATFFDQLITVLYDIADKKHGVLPIKTMFLLDEFANLGKINDYEGTLSTCRGLGMEMITIVQDLAQLENKYGKEIGRTILNNHDTKLFLRTGDVETAKYFSGLAGETTARMKTSSTSQSGGIFTNNSSASKSSQEQYVKRPLITDGELMQIKKNECYLFVSGYYPLKLQKAWQYEIYGEFLFSKDRKPNYSKFRGRYIDFLEKKKKSTPVDKEDQPQNTEDNKTEDAVNIVNNPEEKHKPLEEKIQKESIVEVTKEIIEEPSEDKNNRKFELFAQEFLVNMKKQETNEVIEVPSSVTNNEDATIELVESINEPIDATAALQEIFASSGELEPEEIEEHEQSFSNVEMYVKTLTDHEDIGDRFLEHLNDESLDTSEEEAVLMGGN